MITYTSTNERPAASIDHYRSHNMRLTWQATERLKVNTAWEYQDNCHCVIRLIAENRAAVTSEPASVAARETLFQALRSKVSLLQDTITLINEMRKGNNAAAAQLVNKS